LAFIGQLVLGSWIVNPRLLELASGRYLRGVTLFPLLEKEGKSKEKALRDHRRANGWVCAS